MEGTCFYHLLSGRSTFLINCFSGCSFSNNGIRDLLAQNSDRLSCDRIGNGISVIQFFLREKELDFPFSETVVLVVIIRAEI